MIAYRRCQPLLQVSAVRGREKAHITDFGFVSRYDERIAQSATQRAAKCFAQRLEYVGILPRGLLNRWSMATTISRN